MKCECEGGHFTQFDRCLKLTQKPPASLFSILLFHVGSEETLPLAKQNCTTEWEFSAFCGSRLRKQYLALNNCTVCKLSHKSEETELFLLSRNTKKEPADC